MMLVNKLVELLDEGDRFKVLASTVNVRKPSALFARVVEVQHRGHGVNSQAVDVIFLQPEERVSEQIISHLVALVIEDQRSPILMLAFARVGVFVQMRAVEESQPVPVFRKVSRHPIQNHAYVVAMAVIDEVHELVRLTVAARRRVVADCLIAPASVVWMLGDRQQLDVRIAHLLYVFDQLVSKLTICQIAAAFFGRSHPRAEMHFVNGNRRVECVLPGALAHPGFVAPLILVNLVHDGGCLRAALEIERVRIGLSNDQAETPPLDFELVESLFSDSGNENLPEARSRMKPHWVTPAVPVIEVADDTDALRVGRPHSEVDSANAVDDSHVRTELFVVAIVSAFGHQMKIVIREQGREAVRVVKLPRVSEAVGSLQAIGESLA